MYNFRYKVLSVSSELFHQLPDLDDMVLNNLFDKITWQQYFSSEDIEKHKKEIDDVERIWAKD